MGMYGHYRQVTNKELDEIRNSRKIQEYLVYYDSPESPDYFCIEKNWMVIDFLLCRLQLGESFSSYPDNDITYPLKDIILGGKPLDENYEEDNWFDFGPIRYLSPEQVTESSAHLNKITPENLVANYDQLFVNQYEIYPDIWDREDEMNHIKDEIKYYYSELVRFFQKAATDRKYILMYIT